MVCVPHVSVKKEGAYDCRVAYLYVSLSMRPPSSLYLPISALTLPHPLCRPGAGLEVPVQAVAPPCVHPRRSAVTLRHSGALRHGRGRRHRRLQVPGRRLVQVRLLRLGTGQLRGRQVPQHAQLDRRQLISRPKWDARSKFGRWKPASQHSLWNLRFLYAVKGGDWTYFCQRWMWYSKAGMF